MIMVPEAYQNQPDLDNYPEITLRILQRHSGAWDGPALLVFSDGLKVGATLDRNGLRPARYSITRDGYIVVAGAGSGLTQQISWKGPTGPGQMIAVIWKPTRC